jgi:hypothetical protein
MRKGKIKKEEWLTGVTLHPEEMPDSRP